MTFDEIFEAYYTIYRLETPVPASSDDEYLIAIPLANEAINRWSRYDGTYWKELYTTLTLSDNNDTIESGTAEYDAPDDFKEGGGFVQILDPTSGDTVRRYPILDPQQAQFKNDAATYCFFTGDPSGGYTLHLNPAPDDAIDGFLINYVYYKKPTTFVSGGSETTEMNDPYFIVHRMLYNRFRGSRNPYLTTALRDAEDILKTMQIDNNSGSWANPWKLQDNSGSTFGA